VSKNNLSDCEFRESRHGESHNLRRGVNEFLSVLSVFTIRIE
jgi:hypothetical protein